MGLHRWGNSGKAKNIGLIGSLESMIASMQGFSTREYVTFSRLNTNNSENKTRVWEIYVWQYGTHNRGRFVLAEFEETFLSGFYFLRKQPTPDIVPPVLIPTMNISTFPLKSSIFLAQ